MAGQSTLDQQKKSVEMDCSFRWNQAQFFRMDNTNKDGRFLRVFDTQRSRIEV